MRFSWCVVMRDRTRLLGLSACKCGQVYTDLLGNIRPGIDDFGWYGFWYIDLIAHTSSIALFNNALTLQFGIQSVPQAVSHHIERHDRQHDGQTRKNCQPGGYDNIIHPGLEHEPPAGIWWLGPQSQKAEAGFDSYGRGGPHAGPKANTTPKNWVIYPKQN